MLNEEKGDNPIASDKISEIVDHLTPRQAMAFGILIGSLPFKQDGFPNTLENIRQASDEDWQKYNNFIAKNLVNTHVKQEERT